MKTTIILAVTLAALAGCNQGTAIRHDQCLRREIFQQCMAVIPQGPLSTKYNDWAEVITECENAAKYQAVREVRHIKPECRP